MEDFIKKHDLEYLLETDYQFYLGIPDDHIVISVDNMLEENIRKCIEYCHAMSYRYNPLRLKEFLKNKNLTNNSYETNHYDLCKSILPLYHNLHHKIMQKLKNKLGVLKYLWLYRETYDALVISHHQYYYLLYDIKIKTKYKQEDEIEQLLCYYSEIKLEGQFIREDGLKGEFELNESIGFDDKKDFDYPNGAIFPVHRSPCLFYHGIIFKINGKELYRLTSVLQIDVHDTIFRNYAIIPLYKKYTIETEIMCPCGNRDDDKCEECDDLMCEDCGYLCLCGSGAGTDMCTRCFMKAHVNDQEIKGCFCYRQKPCCYCQLKCGSFDGASRKIESSD